MRSRDDDTKFHSMNRGPTGSPPSSITVDIVTARIVGAPPGAKTSNCPAVYVLPSTSTPPLAT
jgi:hypothetical protein